MTEIQSEFGDIEWKEDFSGPELLVAGTGVSGNIFKDFRVIGDGIAEADSGITISETDPYMNGVGILTTTDETKHGVHLATALCIKPSTMGPVVLEERVQYADLDAKAGFMGLSIENGDELSLEDDLINGVTTTLTLTGTHFAGFFWDEGLTDDEDLHAVYNGGDTACSTTSTNQDLDCDMVAGEFQIRRLEVDENGTCRWYVDEKLKKTVVGAIDPDQVFAAICGVESKASSIEYAYLDYFIVKCHRDWNI